MMFHYVSKTPNPKPRQPKWLENFEKNKQVGVFCNVDVNLRRISF